MNLVLRAQRLWAQLLPPIRRPLVILSSCAILANGAFAATGTAVEYFHAEFGHYFVTSFSDEIEKLDNGYFAGWARTGYSFSVATDASGGLPVCRFFSTAFGAKSSHFYTPYEAECASLKQGTTWSYEDSVFYLALPSAAGMCPSDGTAIYRLYNDGMGGAPNHRYTAVRAVFDAMQAQGWAPEGDGVTGVFACGPPAPKGGSTLVSLLASNLAQSYDVSITVPAGYHPNSDPVPVIYALDAQYRLLWLQAAMQETGVRAILVAIFDMGRRQTDFNVPGAWDFLPFLTKDLIPYIETNYRADPRRRVLSGHSLGGIFVFHALYLEAPSKWSFAHYWSAEGSFWQDIAHLEERWMFDAVGRSPFPVTLIMARGTSGQDNSDFVRAMYDQIASRHYEGMRLLDLYYPNLDHVAMDAPAFRDSLKVLFGQ